MRAAYGLCSVNVRRVGTINGNVLLQDLPSAPYAHLSQLVMTATGTKNATNVGCCTVVDAMSCDTWSEDSLGPCDAVSCP